MKRKVLAFILLGKLMLISGAFLCYAYATDLRVIVTDPWGEALHMPIVRLDLEKGGTSYDDRGSEIFKDLDPGKYTLSFNVHSPYFPRSYSEIIDIKGDYMEFKMVLRHLGVLEIFLVNEDGKPYTKKLGQDLIRATLGNTNPRYLGEVEFVKAPNDMGKVDLNIPEGRYNLALLREGNVVNEAQIVVTRDEVKQLDMIIPSRIVDSTSAIPGFTFESMILGLAIGIFSLWLFHKK